MLDGGCSLQLGSGTMSTGRDLLARSLVKRGRHGEGDWLAIGSKYSAKRKMKNMPGNLTETASNWNNLSSCYQYSRRHDLGNGLHLSKHRENQLQEKYLEPGRLKLHREKEKCRPHCICCKKCENKARTSRDGAQWASMHYSVLKIYATDEKGLYIR